MQELEAAEREARIRQKMENAAEATHVLSSLEAKKRNEFEQKKNDKTNLIQTVALQEEVSHRMRENNVQNNVVRSSLRGDLQNQSAEKQVRATLNKVEDLHGDVATTGFEFECYTRDPMMKQEARRTSGFQRGQLDAEHFRKTLEKQDRVAPDGTTLSDIEINAI